MKITAKLEGVLIGKAKFSRTIAVPEDMVLVPVSGGRAVSPPRLRKVLQEYVIRDSGKSFAGLIDLTVLVTAGTHTLVFRAKDFDALAALEVVSLV